MRENPVICIDFDDTMNELLPAWVSYLNENYHLRVKLSDVKSWEMKYAFPMLSEDEIYEPLHNPNFWKLVQEKNGASYYINKLIAEGFEVYVCTSTHPDIASFKFKNCLFRLFPFLDYHHIITTYNKQLIYCDILIDDGVHNIEGPYFGLLMDMPHNRDFQVDNRMTYRVHDWEQAFNKIHKLIGGEAEYYEI